MRLQLANRLCLDIGQSEVTQSVSMQGNNTIEVDCVTCSGQVDVQYEQSNDLENWTALGVLITGVSAPYALLGSQSPTAAYVRLRITESSGAGPVVVAVGVNLFSQ